MSKNSNEMKWLVFTLIAIPIYLVGKGLYDGASTAALVVLTLAGVTPGLILLVLVLLSKFGSNRPNLSGIVIEDGEAFERQFMASRAFGLVTVGGLLTATSERLIFVPHRFNIGPAHHKETLSIRWEDVRSTTFGAYPLALLTSVALHGMGSSSEKLIVEHAGGRDQFVVVPTSALVDCLQAHQPNPDAAIASA